MPVTHEAKAVASRLAAAVASAGWTQNDVGQVLGRSQAQVSKRLNGHVPLRATEVTAIVQALRAAGHDVDLVAVFSGEPAAA